MTYSKRFNKYENEAYKIIAIGDHHLMGVPIDTCYITATQGTSYRGIGNVSMGGIPCTFVDGMPDRFDVAYNGYLLYDLENELFAGPKGIWEKRVKDVLIEGEDVNFPSNKDDETVPRFSMIALYALARGDEVVLVPCISYESRYESRIDGDLSIYQEFNWQSAFGLKSKSGVLPIM